LRHVAQRGPPPLAAEDLVVLGVLAALLEEVGASEVRACVSGAPVLPEPNTVALEAAARDGLTACWTLAWRAPAARPQEPALRQGAACRTGTGLTAPAAETLVSVGWPDVVMQAARLLACDLASPPSVAALARRMDRSTRSLQRALGDAGSGYSMLLAVMRCRAASWWLVHTTSPVAEVGFVCGYSDQPHFSREFRHRVGLAPAAFRVAFAATG
jgi:AraC-like DNA-binding protein